MPVYFTSRQINRILYVAAVTLLIILQYLSLFISNKCRKESKYLGAY